MVGAQLRQVGRVAAEVGAGDAGELVGAGGPSGLDVGRLGADAVGDGDLADAHARAGGVVDLGDGRGPDGGAATGDLACVDPVDGAAQPLLTDAVVALVVAMDRWSMSSLSVSGPVPWSAWRWQ